MSSGEFMLTCCSATWVRSAAVSLGSDGVVVEFSLDCDFEFIIFMAFEAVACTGVLASRDGAKGVVVAKAGSRLLFGMSGFVEVGFELDFTLQAILQNSNTAGSV